MHLGYDTCHSLPHHLSGFIRGDIREVCDACSNFHAKPLKRPPLWSSFQLGLKTGTSVTYQSRVEFQLGLNRQEGLVHCPRAPTPEPSNKQRAPTQERAVSKQKSKLVLCRPRASLSSSCGRMSGRPWLVCVPLLCLLVALVGRSWCLVPPGCCWSTPVSSSVLLRDV